MPVNAKKEIKGGYDPRKRAPRTRASNDLYVDELKARSDYAKALKMKEGIRFWETGGRQKRLPEKDEYSLIWLKASTTLDQAKRKKCEPVIIEGKQEEYGDLKLYIQPATEAWKHRDGPAQEALDQFDDTYEGMDKKYSVADAEGNRHSPVLAE